MQTFKIYVTNITEALSVLQQANISAKNGGTFVEVEIDPTKQTETILLLNKGNIVVYDIEAAS
ncbi:hypothetical protein [Caryophanon latum]|uniref:Uncharacterized protein n=1 Tax=Caryophanon latum TaxID=33977 RepID=A0A1C0YPS9_9BACL|nr:hypothetical protein [Caryophanon latum]OCS89177.1 hypothetical protein A6K76_02370 [Caryophanon latum]